jgi:hypothetical protein
MLDSPAHLVLSWGTLRKGGTQMSDYNPYALRIEQQARDRRNGNPAGSNRPYAEIKKELKRMGLKRTPGTNGEGRKVTVVVGGTEYKIWATEA